MSQTLIPNGTGGEIVLTEKLSDDLATLYCSEKYSDVTFLVEDENKRIERIPCHKIILAARSEYFRALLYGGLSETNKKEISLKVPLKAFKNIILKYVYTGKANLGQFTTPQMNLILDTLGLANLFSYTELKDEIATFLKSSLNVNNVCCILDSAVLYDIDDLSLTCYAFIDKHAELLLQHESFKYLNKNSLIILLARDSFYVQEISIFEAVKGWIEANQDLRPDDISEVVAQIRLPLIDLEDLLVTVRPAFVPGILDANALLDAIHIKTQVKKLSGLQGTRLPYRGKLVIEENIAKSTLGAKVIQGVQDGLSLLEGSNHPYDMEKGFTRHGITTKNDSGLVIELNAVYIINYLKILLWDLDPRHYSYVIDVSVENELWERVIDYSEYHCRSWQYLYFEKRPVRFIRITGTHNSANRIFHLVSVEAMFTHAVPKLSSGLIVPSVNVATVEKSAIVLEGVSRNKNSLLNGNIKDYDWDCGYTCHQLGSGNISLQLGQPYVIGSLRILLWDCDERTYSFYIESSLNGTDWEMLVDRKNERLQSWQSFAFEPRAISYIRITGTFNSANEIFHIVHFECPKMTSDGEK